MEPTCGKSWENTPSARPTLRRVRFEQGWTERRATQVAHPQTYPPALAVESDTILRHGGGEIRGSQASSCRRMQVFEWGSISWAAFGLCSLLESARTTQGAKTRTMSDAAGRFSRRSDENLLQLWRGRGGLDDELIEPLRDEIEKRGLSKEIEKMDGEAPSKDIYGELPTAPQTYLNASVAVWWLRELWLRYRTKDGIQVNAAIESIQRTRSGFGGVARAEIVYSYEFLGQQFSGRVVRDFSFDVARADGLIYDHQVNEKLPVLISRDNPAISYFPSGLGAFDPIALGFRALFSWAIVIALLRFALMAVLPQR